MDTTGTRTAATDFRAREERDVATLRSVLVGPHALTGGRP